MPEPSRWEVLVAIARAKPPGTVLAQLEATAAELHPGERVQVLVAIASAYPDESERVLATARAVADGDWSDRAGMLVAIATATRKAVDRERLSLRPKRRPSNRFSHTRWWPSQIRTLEIATGY